MDLKEILAAIEERNAQLAEVSTKLEGAATSEEVAEFKAMVEKVGEELETLTKERDERIAEEEHKALAARVTSLQEVVDDLRSGFPVGDPGQSPEGKAVASENPYEVEEGVSYFNDIRMANKGREEAIARIRKATGSDRIEGKAMSEGVGAQGGYLVQPVVERQIVQTVELDNVLRGLCSKINVSTTAIELNQITVGTTAGWVAELAEKPESTALTLATVTATVFTAAGLATISNQLLADANPAVDALVTSDLAKRLTALEETAFLAGSGTGQPLGILNTPGVHTQTVTVTDVGDDNGLLDKILDAIADVQTDVGQPTAILMHPRTWTKILKDKNSAGVYTIGSPADANNNSPALQNGRTIATGPEKTLWGVRVVLSNRIPTNLGTGSNESRVIVGDFTEALILDRQGITVDESPHVYFTSNQTVFRAEKRVGFTAARQPKAFSVIGGAGLADS